MLLPEKKLQEITKRQTTKRGSDFLFHIVTTANFRCHSSTRSCANILNFNPFFGEQPLVCSATQQVLCLQNSQHPSWSSFPPMVILFFARGPFGVPLRCGLPSRTRKDSVINCGGSHRGGVSRGCTLDNARSCSCVVMQSGCCRKFRQTCPKLLR